MPAPEEHWTFVWLMVMDLRVCCTSLMAPSYYVFSCTLDKQNIKNQYMWCIIRRSRRDIQMDNLSDITI